MLLAFSDKIFYIKGYALGGQIYFEIPINSIGGNTPILCGFAECIISTDTGYLRNQLKVIICCNRIGLSVFLSLAQIGPNHIPDKHHRADGYSGIYYSIEHHTGFV